MSRPCRGQATSSFEYLNQRPICLVWLPRITRVPHTNIKSPYHNRIFQRNRYARQGSLQIYAHFCPIFSFRNHDLSEAIRLLLRAESYLAVGAEDVDGRESLIVDILNEGFD